MTGHFRKLNIKQAQDTVSARLIRLPETVTCCIKYCTQISVANREIVLSSVLNMYVDLTCFG